MMKKTNMRLIVRKAKGLIHEFYARGITLDENCGEVKSYPGVFGKPIS